MNRRSFLASFAAATMLVPVLGPSTLLRRTMVPGWGHWEVFCHMLQYDDLKVAHGYEHEVRATSGRMERARSDATHTYYRVLELGKGGWLEVSAWKA